MNPIFSVPFDRREFLVASGGLAAASVAAPAHAAEEKPVFSCALLSDTHLGRSRERESKLMKSAIAEVNKSRAQFTIFCGDLVNRGHVEGNEKRYGEWKEIAGGLKKPHYSIPGNHDPISRFTRHIRKTTDYFFDHRNIRFVCFRNAQPNPGHNGVVTPNQIKWLDATIAQAGKKSLRVVLFAHVAYHANKHPDVGWYIKEGRAAFEKLLQKHKHICALFSGHFHCGLRGWNDTHGIHEIVLPSTSWNRNRGLAKAPGYSLDEFRPGYAMLDVFADSLRVTYQPIGNRAKAHKTLPLNRPAKR